MPRERLTPPSLVAMPAAIAGPMPRGDAADPPVDRIALSAARDIDAFLDEPLHGRPTQRITRMQIIIARAIDEALDRCQRLGGRRVR